jgi:hypothetical protein
LCLAKTPSDPIFEQANPGQGEFAITAGRPHPAGMLFLLKPNLWTAIFCICSRHALVLENLALRQQLATLMHGRRRPQPAQVDRLFWVALRGLWPDWISALAIVRPATVVA